MITTKTWLQQNRTKKGGWTKAQAHILGLPYPLKKGWQSLIINKEITESEARRFELAASVPAKNQIARIMSMIARLPKHQFEIVREWINNY